MATDWCHIPCGKEQSCRRLVGEAGKEDLGVGNRIIKLGMWVAICVLTVGFASLPANTFMRAFSSSLKTGMLLIARRHYH